MTHLHMAVFRLAVKVVAGLSLILIVSTPARASIDISVVETPAGFTVWHVEDHTIPLIAVELMFRDAGASQDPADKIGLANFVAGILDQGAGDMDADAFQDRLDDLSIRLGFGAGRDRFSVSMATLTDRKEEAFRLMGLALSEPRFDAAAVQRVRNQLISAVNRGDENPSVVVRRAWYAEAYPDHPYGRPIEGTVDSLRTIDRDALSKFAATRLARDNVIIAVVGDIDAETLGPLVDDALLGLNPESERVTVPEAAANPPAGIRVVHRPIPQSTVFFGHDGIRRDHPDWYAAQVMNYVLGGGSFASRLVNEVREKRGLAYSVASFFSPLDHGGMFLGVVGTQNERVGESIDVIRDEVARIVAEGVTEDELKDAQTFLTGSYPLTFSSSRDIAGQLAALQADGFDPDYVKRRNGLIEAVTLEDVNAAARNHLDPDRLFWVVVGQPAGVEDTAPAPVPDASGD